MARSICEACTRISCNCSPAIPPEISSDSSACTRRSGVICRRSASWTTCSGAAVCQRRSASCSRSDFDVHLLARLLQRQRPLRAHAIARGLVHADLESDLACRAVVCPLQLEPVPPERSPGEPAAAVAGSWRVAGHRDRSLRRSVAASRAHTPGTAHHARPALPRALRSGHSPVACPCRRTSPLRRSSSRSCRRLLELSRELVLQI